VGQIPAVLLQVKVLPIPNVNWQSGNRVGHSCMRTRTTRYSERPLWVSKTDCGRRQMAVIGAEASSSASAVRSAV
jgi:hypothetical protein